MLNAYHTVLKAFAEQFSTFFLHNEQEASFPKSYFACEIINTSKARPAIPHNASLIQLPELLGGT